MRMAREIKECSRSVTWSITSIREDQLFKLATLAHLCPSKTRLQSTQIKDRVIKLRLAKAQEANNKRLR